MMPLRAVPEPVYVPDARLPDLLHPRARLRIDAERTRAAMAIAFAGGTSGGLFAEALDRAALEPSAWAPDAFQEDLFIKAFVLNCMRARVGNDQPVLGVSYLVRLITHPPADPAVVQHRRDRRP
jgi:DNA mismatch repair protein MutS2